MKNLHVRSAVVGAGLVVLGMFISSGAGVIPLAAAALQEDVSVRSLTVRSAAGVPLISLRSEQDRPILELLDAQGRLLVKASSEDHKFADQGGDASSNGELILRANFPVLLDDIGFQCRLLSNGLNLESLEEDSDGAFWDAAVALRPGFLRFADESTEEKLVLNQSGGYVVDADGKRRWKLDAEGVTLLDSRGRERILVSSDTGEIIALDEEGNRTVIPQGRGR